MFITKVKLKNFRCFENSEFDFKKQFIIVEGNNGSGKTSLLESIYYACYLRSFKTRLNSDLINFDNDHFFIQIHFDDELGSKNQIQIGYSDQKGKLVKLNQKQVQSYKDLIDYYKVISITQDDLQLVSGAPEFRRSFLNQSLFLLDSDFVFNLRKYKQILEQRNSFLLKNIHSKLIGSLERELFTWTKQLWKQSLVIQKSRIIFLEQIEKEINKSLKNYFYELEDVFINLKYISKNMNTSHDFEDFWKYHKQNFIEKELRWGRSFFGLHLDDFSISFRKKRAKVFASRGQQKLILFLLKNIQLQKLQEKDQVGCLLLDDFLTDFDDIKLKQTIFLLKDIKSQIFLTMPLKSFISSKISDSFNIQVHSL